MCLFLKCPTMTGIKLILLISSITALSECSDAMERVHFDRIGLLEPYSPAILPAMLRSTELKQESLRYRRTTHKSISLGHWRLVTGPGPWTVHVNKKNKCKRF